MEIGFTKENLQKLDQAIASGVRSVSFNEKTISYHSLDELIKLRNQMARCVLSHKTKRQFFPRVEKGV